MTGRKGAILVTDPVTYTPIGVIRSPHTVFDKTPIQPVFAGGFEGRV